MNKQLIIIWSVQTTGPKWVGSDVTGHKSENQNYDKTSSVTITVSEDANNYKNTGVRKYTAIAVGNVSVQNQQNATTTGYSYYVASARISAPIAMYYDDYSGWQSAGANCTKTYGNGASRNCNSEMDHNEEHNTTLGRKFKFTYDDRYTNASAVAYTTFLKLAAITIDPSVDHTYVEAFHNHARDGVAQCYQVYHVDGVSLPNIDCTARMNQNTDYNYNGWSLGQGKRTVKFYYTHTAGNTHSKTVYQNVYYVTNVKFSGTKAGYTTTDSVYKEEFANPNSTSMTLKNITVADEPGINIKCTKTYGDGTKGDCTKDSNVYNQTTKSDTSTNATKASHNVTGKFYYVDGFNGHSRTFLPGESVYPSWNIGEGIRNVQIGYLENRNKKDKWLLQMRYIINVRISGGTSSSIYIAVYDAHDKEIQSYNNFVKGLSGNDIRQPSVRAELRKVIPYQEMDLYKKPTVCTKTYGIATQVESTSKVRDCLSQVEHFYNYSDTTSDLWQLGKANRVYRFKYRENQHSSTKYLHFTHAKRVDITITRPVTYQDRAWGEYTCTTYSI